MEGLERFLKAQENVYEQALNEIKSGHKKSHWMWYIFPQIRGLGRSETAKFYEIKDRAEAIRYLEHPILGKRLIEISTELLKLKSSNPEAVMGWPDNLKLKSSMTLFGMVSDDPIFKTVLRKYYDGKQDGVTYNALLD
ncbi:DUF1810 domain-containing protein [Eubacteriaceae bacterium ES3]|nr:DUF1810 domain-containing protein [Eubacteriaceae bacterium ES3]